MSSFVLLWLSFIFSLSAFIGVVFSGFHRVTQFSVICVWGAQASLQRTHSSLVLFYDPAMNRSVKPLTYSSQKASLARVMVSVLEPCIKYLINNVRFALKEVKRQSFDSVELVVKQRTFDEQ